MQKLLKSREFKSSFRPRTILDIFLNYLSYIYKFLHNFHSYDIFLLLKYIIIY